MWDSRKHQRRQLTVVKTSQFSITRTYSMQMRPTLQQLKVWRRNFQYLRYNNYYYIYKISRRTFEISAYSVKNIEVTNPEHLLIKKIMWSCGFRMLYIVLCSSCRNNNHMHYIIFTSPLTSYIVIFILHKVTTVL